MISSASQDAGGNNPGFSATFNLGNEFDNEAGSHRDNPGDSNSNHRKTFGYEGDDDDDEVPPVPPSHALDEEDYADYFEKDEESGNENDNYHDEENSYDEDDSIFNLHLGHRGNNDNNANVHGGNGNRIGSNLTFDSYDDFGEETLNAILDADLRLSAIPPLSTNFSSTAETGSRANDNIFSRGSFGGLELRSIPDRRPNSSFQNVHSHEFKNFKLQDISSNAKDHEMSAKNHEARTFSYDERDDIDDMSSEGVDSLFRGPLMAAQSSARARYKETGTSRIFGKQREMNEEEKELYRSDDKVDSNSASGRIMISPQDPTAKETIMGKSDQSGIAQTPSAARNQLLPSPRMGTIPPTPGPFLSAATGSTSKSKPALSHSSQSGINQESSATPSEVRNKVFSSPQDPSPIPLLTSSSRPPSRQYGVVSDTPSNARERFMGYSPQESSTSMCSRNSIPPGPPPSSHHEKHGAGNSEMAEDLSNKENIVDKWMDCLSDVHSNVKSNHHVSNEKTSTHASSETGNGRRLDPYNGEKIPVLHGANDEIEDSRSPMVVGNKNSGSLEDIIAMGEAQMRQASNNINNTASAECAESRRNNANLPPKKSFLRKGARKEPSSLHKFSRDATKANSSTQSSNDHVPSQAHSNETSQERKARLAELERLQQDCLRDLEKRQQRKEEARKERRSKKIEEIETKGVSTGGSSEQSGQNQPTPSQMRPRSVSREKTHRNSGNPNSRARSTSASRVQQSAISAAESKNNNYTLSHDSRGVTIDEEKHPTPSQMRPPSASKEIPPKVINADIHNVSGITECSEHPTPSQIRQPSTPFEYEDSHHFDEEKKDLVVEGMEKEIGEKKNIPSGDNCLKGTDKENKHPRSLSAPRPTNNKAKQQTKSGKSRNAKTSNDGDEKEGFEEWKRKEEEQWSLIKNMRKRQEAALREAEGELQRAKAWAAAERESVHKWADEQRELIRKDRHKAANAALLASKKANKENKKNENISGDDAMKSEIQRLRAELKKMKTEVEKAAKLKEKVGQQEKKIKELLSEKNNKEKMSLKDTRKANSGSTGVLSDSTTKQNRQGPSKPEEKESRKVILKNTRSLNAPNNMRQQLVPNDDEVATVTDEHSNNFLQRSLETLNNANNKLDDKLSKNKDPFIPDVNQINQSEVSQKKPYNAADYTGNDVTQLSHHMKSAAMPSPLVQNSGSFPSDSQVLEKCRVFTYRNGTQKTVQHDGTTTISFANGDKKRTYANEKKGIVVYYYAATKTTQITHQNGMETYHFPNNQIENHHRDGRKEITYPDGTKRMVFPDGTCDTKFPDGVRVIEYPDGTQQVTQSY